MRILPAALLLLLAVSALAGEEPSVIEVAAPPGWTLSAGRDKNSFHLTSGTTVLDASIYPDEKNAMATKEALEGLMRQSFGHMLEGAVQTEMTFAFADTPGGFMGHTVFTDKKWVGREIPKNEWRHATAGVRRWPNAFVHFTILSNDLESEEYRQALDVVKSAFRQTKGAR